jgi:hypothetical protein
MKNGGGDWDAVQFAALYAKHIPHTQPDILPSKIPGNQSPPPAYVEPPATPLSVPSKIPGNQSPPPAYVEPPATQLSVPGKIPGNQ